MKSIEILNTPLKASLFGRFYEEIIRKWLGEVKGYSIGYCKPRIYWKNQEPKQEIKTNKEERLLDELQEKRKTGTFCTPDGLLEKYGKKYIWEAKNWAQWSSLYDKKIYSSQIDYVLWTSPWLLADNYGKEKEPFDGFIFTWWHEESYKKYEKEINMFIKPRTIEIYLTTDILDNCRRNQYDWFIKYIQEQEKKLVGSVSEIFNALKESDID